MRREVQIAAAFRIAILPNESPIAMTRTGELLTVRVELHAGLRRHRDAGAVLKLRHGGKGPWKLQSVVRWAA